VIVSPHLGRECGLTDEIAALGPTIPQQMIRSLVTVGVSARAEDVYSIT
jgi:hypothetical protein